MVAEVRERNCDSLEFAAEAGEAWSQILNELSERALVLGRPPRFPRCPAHPAHSLYRLTGFLFSSGPDSPIPRRHRVTLVQVCIRRSQSPGALRSSSDSEFWPSGPDSACLGRRHLQTKTPTVSSTLRTLFAKRHHEDKSQSEMLATHITDKNSIQNTYVFTLTCARCSLVLSPSRFMFRLSPQCSVLRGVAVR